MIRYFRRSRPVNQARLASLLDLSFLLMTSLNSNLHPAFHALPRTEAACA